MNYSLGLDGGGSKTEAVLLEDSGRIVGRCVTGPSNPLRVGFTAAAAALEAAAEGALAEHSISRSQLCAVCAGVAGAGRETVAAELLQYLRKMFPGAIAHVTTDMDIALEAAAGSGPGIVLIAGTGSAAYGRNAASQTARAGGYGPQIGDEGSAYDIGRWGVAAAARARDLTGPPTVLSDAIPRALAEGSWDNLIQQIPGNAEQIFPRVFAEVVNAAEFGDSTAREILVTAALKLSRIALTVLGRLEMRDTEFLLAKTGGVFGRSKLLDNRVDTVLAEAAPHAKIEQLTVAPAVGAARLAERLAIPPRPSRDR